MGVRSNCRFDLNLEYCDLKRAQWIFAHVTTVSLSWRVHNFVIIGRRCYDVSGMGAWSHQLTKRWNVGFFVWSLFNLTGAWEALRHCCQGVCHISESYDNFVTQLCVFQTSWDWVMVNIVADDGLVVLKKSFRLRHLSLNKMAAISPTIISDAFSRMKGSVFWFKFHCLFLRVQLTITQHWFSSLLGAE